MEIADGNSFGRGGLGLGGIYGGEGDHILTTLPSGESYYRSLVSYATESDNSNQYESEQKHIRRELGKYGILSRKICLYRELREIVDTCLHAAGISSEGVEFDCVLSENKNAQIYSRSQCILLHSGFISDAVSKDKIASIISHEIGHLKYSEKPEVVTRFSPKVRKFILAREEERVADIEALRIVSSAGYNPRELVDVFKNDLKDGVSDSTFLRILGGISHTFKTPHETSERRVDYLEEYMNYHLLAHTDKKLDFFNEMTLSDISQKEGYQEDDKDSSIGLQLMMGKYSSIEDLLHASIENINLNDAERRFLWKIVLEGGEDYRNQINIWSRVDISGIDITKIIDNFGLIFSDTTLSFGVRSFFPALMSMYGKDEMKIFFQMLAKNYPRGIAECLDIYLSVGKYADMSMFIQDGLDMFRFLLDEGNKLPLEVGKNGLYLIRNHFEEFLMTEDPISTLEFFTGPLKWLKIKTIFYKRLSYRQSTSFVL